MSETIYVHYPIITSTVCDVAESKEKAIKILQKASDQLIDELAKINYQLEEMRS